MPSIETQIMSKPVVKTKTYSKDKMVFSRISTMLLTDLEKIKFSEHDGKINLELIQKI